MESVNEDLQHLDLLRIFHFILGGFGVLFACFPLIHVGLGLLMVLVELDADPEAAVVGWVFVAFGGLFVVIGQAVAWSVIASGRFLGKRTNYLFSFVVACLLCLCFPFGTGLGVFTLIVLSRDSVKRIYGRA